MTLASDVRYALRRLTRAPAFALTAIFVLVAGIGLNLAFFQLLNVTAFQPLRVAGLDSLVRFDRQTKRFTTNGIPYPATQFIRHQNDVLSAVLTSTASDVVWGDDPNDRLRAIYVSANWFAELGYGAAMGRVFAEPIDEQPAAPPVVVVSHDFWRTRLQGEPIAGRAVRVNGRAATVIGVAPARFPGLRLDDTQIWLPIHQMDYFNPGSGFKDDWGAHNTQLYARLRPGVSPAAAREGLRATIRELVRTQPKFFDADETLQPYPGRSGFRSPREQNKLQTLGILVGGLTLIVLVVACANLSNLILSHAIARIRELSVRSALGASRWRLVREQVVESALLATAGAAGGLVAGYWCARVIGVQIALPEHVDVSPDWRTALAAFGIAAIVTFAVGVVPAWIVGRRNLVAAMRDGGQQTSRGLARAPLRVILVASQVAGCCILLLVAGSTVRSLHHMLGSDLGFEFEEVAVLDPSLSRYGIGGEAARLYWDDVKRSVAATLEAERLSLASQSPFGAGASRSTYNDAPRLVVTSIAVEPSFFDLLRIRMLAGRNFESNARADSEIIISRRLAIEMYGTLDVVGKGFPRSKPTWTIIGVAADAPLVNVTATNVAELYRPLSPSDYGRVVLLAKARRSAARLLGPMRDAARAADDRVLPRTSLVATAFEERLQGRRVASLIASLTGLLALSLACFGIFGIVAQSVALRTKEIGIRRALGADRRSVIGLLLRQLTVPLVLGVLAGTATGVATGAALEGDPFYLPSTDIGTYVSVLVLFTLTAAAAAFLPIHRALGTDPLEALRHA